MKINAIKDAKTSDLVEFWNIHHQNAPIKKFADRATAVKRCTALQESLSGTNTAPAPVQVLKSVVNKAIAAGAPVFINKPIAEVPAIEVITDKVSDKALKALEAEKGKKPAKKSTPALTHVETGPKKQNTPPHLNLRCPSCGYYAKTTPACLKLARLICPVDPKHGKLLTADERNEKRGR